MSNGLFSEKIWARNYPPSSAKRYRNKFRNETYTRSRTGKKDQTPQIRSALVGQRAGRVNQRADTVRLQGAPDRRASPSGDCARRLLGLDEFLLRVGGLRAVVDIPEDGGQDSERGSVSEHGAQGDGRGLDSRQVWAID